MRAYLDRLALADTIGLLLLAAAGAAFGGLVIVGDRWIGRGYSPLADYFVEQPETTFWIVLVCAQTALWAVLVVPLVATLRSLRLPIDRERNRERKLGVFVASAAVIAIGAGFSLASSGQRAVYPLPDHETKIGLLSAVGLVLGLLGAMGVWRIDALAKSRTETLSAAAGVTQATSTSTASYAASSSRSLRSSEPCSALRSSARARSGTPSSRGRTTRATFRTSTSSRTAGFSRPCSR